MNFVPCQSLGGGFFLDMLRECVHHDHMKQHEQFSEYLNACGVSNKGAMRLLGISYDTIRHYRYNRQRIPDDVMRRMKDYADCAVKVFG